MLNWLLSPINADAPHLVEFAVAWHGRFMVLAWGILSPMAVFFARYFKVMPGQDWPRELDNQTWWRAHWMGQMLVLGLSVTALVLVLPVQFRDASLHGILGCGVLAGLTVQVLLGLFRGSKGGPTEPAKDGSLNGDHYDMTRRRRVFEAVHKSVGYGVLVLAAVTIIYGLLHANAPNWMWVVLVLWWVTLGALVVMMERRGMAVTSYHAIWGDDPAHPGNAQPTAVPNKDHLDHLHPH
ncbi:cytochrome b561 domain-containing protein [Tateyamaria sp. Alg231-49]|uniref:cytochrome b561 domain-containing protein n=1 Tax=Tateyamaria sp. Alg231-49 TaxID=1922219 RepID=UPI000D54D360|nr:cytochrome b561 domain-containing protein [Tateyamaria sp. Alg231-49]